MRYGFLLSRRWITLAVVLVAAAIACGFLSRWQWHRYEERTAEVERIQANYSADPVPLTSVLAAPDPSLSGTSLRQAREWTRVQASGTYDTDATILIRNRPLDSNSGFYVLTPLHLDDSDTVEWINRGWIPTAADGQTPTDIPAAPAGPVTVTGNIRPPEPSTDRSAPAGQAQTMDVVALSRQVGITDGAEDTRTYRSFIVATAENPEPPTLPRRLPAPDLDLGSHLSYTFQWIVFGVVALAAFWILARRELAEREDARLEREGLLTEGHGGAEGHEEVDSAAGVCSSEAHGSEARGTKARGTARPSRRPSSSRRSRSVDDEEEDELLDRQGF